MTRVALVTGAARGLGRAIADELAGQGVCLFLVDVLAERLEQTRGELANAGATVTVMAADISQRAVCQAAVEAAVATYGHLDVLVNAAGIVRFNHATQVPEDEFQRIMAVNMAAPFWFAQAAIPHLIAARGNMVSVVSQSSLMGAPYIVPYSMSKAALIQMTKGLALEYAEQPIRINAVSPGTMATEIGEGVTRPDDIDFAKVLRYSGQRPPNEAREVAAVVAFVSSPAASAIHGAVLTADGGVTAG
jgi:NAD(P)-dependent dehydrogenase (short-subunit alcohol dehydrogenase family)